MSTPTMSMNAVSMRTARLAGMARGSLKGLEALEALEALTALVMCLRCACCAFQSTFPNAAGGVDRATKPPTATIVSTYGIICTNWLGMPCKPCS
jgi:hypothetical protein